MTLPVLPKSSEGSGVQWPDNQTSPSNSSCHMNRFVTNLVPNLPDLQNREPSASGKSGIQQMMEIWDQLDAKRKASSEVVLHHTSPVVQIALQTNAPGKANSEPTSTQAESSGETKITLSEKELKRLVKMRCERIDELKQQIRSLEIDSACSFERIEQLDLLDLFEGLVYRRIKPKAPEKSGETLLTWIVSRYADEPKVSYFFIDLCLIRGARISEKNHQGMNALTLAISNKEPELAGHLFYRGISKNLLNWEELGAAILHAAKESGACLEEFLCISGPRSSSISDGASHNFVAPMSKYFRSAWKIARKHQNHIAINYLKAHEVKEISD